ncbi:MAG: mannose-6-phosphate isomerase, class I [Spirochaetes bacterium]|nr:mannose-6-phosphate isomerase, class I [Spirochaetota bacterium]
MSANSYINTDLIKAYNFTPVLKNYDWGSFSSIQNIIKRKDLKKTPLAELWMGSHENGDGLVSVSDDRKIKLSEFIKTDSYAILGKAVSKKYNGELPFLFKILAADKPLSIQAHPPKKEAEKGFDKEEKKKIDISAHNRTYKDKNHKPELIYTLTDFYLMKGFRDYKEICSNLSKFSPLFLESAGEKIKKQTASVSPGGKRTKKLFKYLLSIDKNNIQKIINQALNICKKKHGIISDTINKFYSVYGYDPGVLAPLFMNTLKVKPHNALFLPSGELHSYISGTGFEIMANSDNVLRCGLTTKYVDKKGLFKIGVFKKSSLDKGIIKPKAKKNVKKYITDAGEFVFSVISLDKSKYIYNKSTKNFEFFFYIGNGCKVIFPWKNSSYDFINGDSFIIPACAFPYIITGDGKLYAASVNI